MKKPGKLKALAVLATTMLVACAAFVPKGNAQNTLTNGLVAFWPLQSTNGITTPDVVGGANFTLSGNTTFLPTIVSGGSPHSHLNGEAGNAIQFVASQQESAQYFASAGDSLPATKNPGFTVAFWVKANCTNNANNTYVYSESLNAGDPLYPNSSNPLWLFGMDSGGTSVNTDAFGRVLTRDSFAPGGAAETPVILTGQGTQATSSNVFDGLFHYVVITKTASNGNYNVYVDGSYDPGNSGTVNSAGNPTVILPDPVTNSTGGPWQWDTDTVGIGGISRATPTAAGVNAIMDNVAIWDRDLSSNEVGTLYTNGLPVGSFNNPTLKLSTFTADTLQVIKGDTVTLRWTSGNATDISINNGVGDVFADTSPTTGAGSINATITSNTTFIITAIRGASTLKLTNSVLVFTNAVTANWHLIQQFNDVPPTVVGLTGTGFNSGPWTDTSSDLDGSIGLFNNVTEGSGNKANNVLGENPVVINNGPLAGDLEGSMEEATLNSLAVQMGQSNTYFFRFYIADTNIDQSDIWLKMGLCWHGERFTEDFSGGDNGAMVLFTRSGGGILDISESFNGPQNYNSDLALPDAPYSSIVPGGLSSATVYDAWLDLQVNPTTVVTNTDGTTNQLGDIYSFYVAAETNGVAGPVTEVFSNYYADSDLVNPSASLGAASSVLGNLSFVIYDGSIATPGTNTLVFDDFYVSKTGFNHTVPVPASFFPPPYQLTVNAPLSVYLKSDPNNNNNASFTVTWNSSLVPGITYSVLKKDTLTSATWQTLATGISSGGNTGIASTTTSFTDTNVLSSTAFYTVTSP